MKLMHSMAIVGPERSVVRKTPVPRPIPEVRVRT
jgi:hypothetical protein